MRWAAPACSRRRKKRCCSTASTAWASASPTERPWARPTKTSTHWSSGYTHGQRAQPVRWAYVLLAHAWPLVRDRQRLADARRRVAELPLGSGALAGSGFAVDRVLLKEALGLRSISANALDVTGDRDFVAEVLFAMALIGTHLSRLSAELITYASAEFGFVKLSDAFSDAFDTLGLVLPAVSGAIASLTPDAARMEAALDASLRATDLADFLVEAGVPFRDSHGLVGKLVRAAEQAGVALDRVPLAVAAAIHPALGAALSQLGTWETSIEGRATPGGSSRKSVADQIDELRKAFVPLLA